MLRDNDNTENLKKYTRELRELIEDYNVLSLKELNKLQNKNILSSDDIEIIENMALESFDKAKDDFDNGDWDQAISKIEDAMCKSPFNKEILKLHFEIITEKNKIFKSDNDDNITTDLLLKRIIQIDKGLYNKLRKVNRVKKNIKINKLWFFALLILIPIFFIFRSLNYKEQKVNAQSLKANQKLFGEILVKTNNMPHTSEPEIEIVNSDLIRNKNNFLYRLDYSLKSQKENIIYIEGIIHWLNIYGNEIYSEDFKTPKNIEYFLNEEITFTHIKTSQRESPNLDSVLIEITKIISSPGKERDILKEVIVTKQNGITSKITIYEASYIITEGVISNYLSLVLIIKNRGREPIKQLNGSIIWTDELNNILTEIPVKLLTRSEVPIEANEQRLFFKTIEINSAISSKYKIVIKD